jgi:hypothetical protein
VKRTIRDETIGVVTPTPMHGNNTRNSLSLSQIKKNARFLFLPFMFFFYKIREQEGRKGSAQNGGSVGTGGRGQIVGKGVER